MKKFLRTLTEWNNNVEFLMETYLFEKKDADKEERPLRKVYKLPKGGKMKVPGSGVVDVIDPGLTVVDPETLEAGTIVDDDLEDGEITIMDPFGDVEEREPSKLGIRK